MERPFQTALSEANPTNAVDRCAYTIHNLARPPEVRCVPIRKVVAMEMSFLIYARGLGLKFLVLIAAAVGLCTVVIRPTATTRAAEPTTAPAEFTNEVSPRQRNLLLQLADAEASIQAINKALRRTGYKVGVAYDRIASNQKGNELMDR